MIFPYRDKNHPRTFPFFTVLFIFANCLIFFYQMTLTPTQQQYIMHQFGFIPTELTHMKNIRSSTAYSPLLTPFTSMFIHSGFLHLFGNMIYLWIFGDNVEDRLGHFGFIKFYFLCGILAAITHTVIQPNSTIPCVGASGAIAGVLGAYLVLFPRAKILCILFILFFIKIIELPAIVLLSIWFIFQFLSATQMSITNAPGIAFYAHIGGFIAGVVLTLLMKRAVR